MTGLRAATGKAIGVDPAAPFVVYADRDHIASWEEVQITDYSDNTCSVLFVAAQRQLAITSTSPPKLETRPKDAIGPWERFTRSGNAISRVGVTLTIDGPVVPPVTGATLPEVHGTDFTRNGTRVSLVGIDGFLDYRLWLDGGAAKLDPFMAESHALGFEVRRVFVQGDASQNQVLTLWPSREPNWRSQLRPFVTYQNQHGIIPLLTFCVDNQVIGSDINALWRQAADELQGTAVLFSGGNELDKNGGGPATVSDPGHGIPWSRGSRTQDQFYAPQGATAIEFHPVRDFHRTLMDAVASAVYLRDHGCGMLWLDEGIPADTASNPTDFYQLARVYSTLWAVAILHNRQSQRGQLMTDGTKLCAEAWVAGMRL